MLEEQQLAQFKSIVENAQSVIVVLPSRAEIDEVASALGMYLAFREMGKESRLAAVVPPQFSQPQLVGLDQVTTELGNQNLTISFDYKEEHVDKVSYHIGEDTQKFYLTIKPRSGAAPLDTSTVEFSYTGASADVLIFVGVNSLEELQQLYYGYEDLYDSSQIVSFSKTFSRLGQLQLSPTQESGLSELVASIFTALQLPISPDAASNWLAGIEFGTSGLTDGASVGTFESIAALLKAGGVRQPYTQPKNSNTNGVFHSQPVLPKKAKKSKSSTAVTS